MAEEEDPWAFDETDNAADKPAEAPAGGDAAAAPAEGGEKPAEGGEAGQEQAPPPAEDDGYRKPVQLYRHWVRPKFLQYKYVYNYRTNYYDDVIDYLDKKQRGLNRDIPRPQTWAERVLRQSVGSSRSFDYRTKHKEDHHLIQVLAASIKPHNYHSKSYINMKYSKVW